MKPAFSYYGGKQRMAHNIVPLIPPHTVYVEPFAGGAAVFFAKPWPSVTNNDHYREVLNDTNKRIFNFYQQLRDNPDSLIRACCLTPYSRYEHSSVSREPSSDATEEARRWFTDIQQSFSNVSRSGWRTSVFGRSPAATWQSSCSRLYECAERLHSIHIECEDALKVIERWDSPQTFFYCDPPYVGADQGSYSGYTVDDFSALVGALSRAQGSFILSSYANADAGCVIPEGWERLDFSAHVSAGASGKVGKGRDKSRAATQQELGNTSRVESVWRVIRGTEHWRPELQKVHASGALNCFTGRAA